VVGIKSYNLKFWLARMRDLRFSSGLKSTSRLKMEAERSYETLVSSHHSTWCKNADNHKSKVSEVVSFFGEEEEEENHILFFLGGHFEFLF